MLGLQVLLCTLTAGKQSCKRSPARPELSLPAAPHGDGRCVGRKGRSGSVSQWKAPIQQTEPAEMQTGLMERREGRRKYSNAMHRCSLILARIPSGAVLLQVALDKRMYSLDGFLLAL